MHGAAWYHHVCCSTVRRPHKARFLCPGEPAERDEVILAAREFANLVPLAGHPRVEQRRYRPKGSKGGKDGGKSGRGRRGSKGDKGGKGGKWW